MCITVWCRCDCESTEPVYIGIAISVEKYYHITAQLGLGINYSSPWLTFGWCYCYIESSILGQGLKKVSDLWWRVHSLYNIINDSIYSVSVSVCLCTACLCACTYTILITFHQPCLSRWKCCSDSDTVTNDSSSHYSAGWNCFKHVSCILYVVVPSLSAGRGSCVYGFVFFSLLCTQYSTCNDVCHKVHINN